MKTRKQTSTLTLDRYIQINFQICQSDNPLLTHRQIYNKLTSEWYKILGKTEEQKKSLLIEQQQPKKKEQQIKTENQIQVRSNRTKIKQLKKTEKKKVIKKENKKVKSEERKQEQPINKSVKSQEESDFYVTPISEPDNIQQNSLPKLQETKVEQQKVQNKLINFKQKNKKMKKINKRLIKKEESLQKQDENCIPTQDFINSCNLVDYINLITLTTEKNNQGQIELDEIKEIVSHTYGLINNFSDNSNLNLQLFFEVSFLPKENGFIPDNNYCNAKQLALFNYNLYQDYILKHKEIFSKDPDYYIK